jgi:hypothetical protein
VQTEINGRPLTAEDDAEPVRASFVHSAKKPTGTAANELSIAFDSSKSFRFLVINVFNHGEHYETPCIMHGFKAGPVDICGKVQ